MWLKELHGKTGNYRDHNDDDDDDGDDAVTDRGGKWPGRGSATRSNGATRRLGDAGHRGVIGGMGVEGQENRSIVISVKHALDGPPSELDDLREHRSRTESHAETEGTHSGIATRLKRVPRSGDGVVD